MAKPICVGETHDHVDADGTTWTLKILGGRIMAYLNGLVAGVTTILGEYEEDDPNKKYKKGDPIVELNSTTWPMVAIEILRWGLKDVKNFGNLSIELTSTPKFGKPENIVKDRFLDRIPFETQVELANEILRINRLDEEELKNSELQSSCPGSDSTAKDV